MFHQLLPGIAGGAAQLAYVTVIVVLVLSLLAPVLAGPENTTPRQIVTQIVLYIILSGAGFGIASHITAQDTTLYLDRPVNGPGAVEPATPETAPAVTGPAGR